MALGHWAKTYLNPNGGGTELPSVTASDNGKVLGVDGGEYKLVDGATVEIIKIAEWYITDSFEARTPKFVYQAAQIVDNKTLGEIVNGKSIVGLTYDFVEADGSVATPVVYSINAFIQSGVASTKELVAHQEDAQSVKGITLGGIIALQDAHANVPPIVARVYAICI